MPGTKTLRLETRTAFGGKYSRRSRLPISLGSIQKGTPRSMVSDFTSNSRVHAGKWLFGGHGRVKAKMVKSCIEEVLFKPAKLTSFGQSVSGW